MSSLLTVTGYDKSQKIWYGTKNPLSFGPEDSIGSVLLQCLLKDPNLIAQICHQSGRSITYMEMAMLSVQTAQYLETLELQQGDVAGMCLANSDLVAPIFLGCLMAGLCINTLHITLDVEGIKHIYSQTRPKIMFCDGDVHAKMRKVLDECGLSSTKIYTVRNHIVNVASVMEFFKDNVNLKEYRVPQLKCGVNQTALILCSSGTTGPPKGVTISHATFLYNMRINILPPLIYFTFTSLFWLSGVTFLLSPIVNRGTRILSQNSFTAEEFFDIVKRYKVTAFVGTPANVAMTLASNQLAQSDMSSLTFYSCGGSAVPYSLIEKLKRFAPNTIFLQTYTTTEITSTVAMGVCGPDGSIGCLSDNKEVKIIDDEGNKLNPNERGEICVRSITPWAGYIENPSATNAAYDDEEWHHTGDIGYFNDEGKLFIVDRKKDILKYDYFQFSLSEIEKVINELPAVLEVCVVGIPDEAYCYLPAAAVVKKLEDEISASDICEYVKGRMQHYEHLRGGVYFVDRLPRTVGSDKILRREVTKYCVEIHEMENSK